MPAAIATRDATLALLLETFRANGFDAASIATVSAATGLGKSSLYHHFPDGKDQMALAVLEQLEATLERDLFAPLAGPGSPSKRLGAMLDALDAFYAGGTKACLIERLCASVARPRFQGPLQRLVARWIGALEALLRDAGLPRATARARAEDAVVRVEGALVVSAALDDAGPFARTLASLRKSLLTF